jgi:hypothetical protein
MKKMRFTFLLAGLVALVLATTSIPAIQGAEEDRAIVEKAIGHSRFHWLGENKRPPSPGERFVPDRRLFHLSSGLEEHRRGLRKF